MKKSITLVVLGAALLFVMNSFYVPFYSSTAPSGYTGAESVYCDDCHNDNGLNPGGGSVVATGLPALYQAGKAYDFSIKISETAGAKIWGFSIKAVLANGSPVGTFSSTNTSCVVADNELKASPAVVATATSYTFSNLRWTAPSSGTAGVIFYIAAVAGDNRSGNNGDKVYATSSTSSILPVVLEQFNAVGAGKSVQLEWKTSGQNNFKHFDIERSTDGANYSVLGTVVGGGGSEMLQSYSFADSRLPVADAQLYYRLKIIDWDGNFEYSRVVRVYNPAAGTLRVRIFPSVVPRGDDLQLLIQSRTSQPATIIVYDVNGQKLSEMVRMVLPGQNRLTISGLSDRQAGTVMVRIITADFSETHKVLIQ